MQISNVGVHESVRAIFSPSVLADALESPELSVSVVGDEPGALDDCDAVVTFSHRDAFLADEIRWVHSVRAGYDEFPLEEFEAADVALTNSTGIHGTSVGETAVGMLLSFARRLHHYAKHQVDHAWDRPDWDEPFTLAGESLCVVGLGTLGQGIATRADALGMHVTGVKRTVEPVPGVETVYANGDLHEAIAEARFVALAVPLTAETEGLFGDVEFDRMRDDAYLVNVARGPVVDQDALVAALRDGRLAGAGLDVFEEEPLPESSPLWDLDEVVVTPHVAAAERDYYRHIAALVEENLDNAADGSTLTNRVV